ncbi:MAG: DUF2283 domain-containing protein [Alphaproteobacteria bacterium]|nr:MAG: DUF2283 domain-containing protein [Alphaproteobacteria bacterium]
MSGQSLTGRLLGDPAPDRHARADELRRSLPSPRRRMAAERVMPMISYAPAERAVLVKLSAAPSVDCTEVAPGVFLDVDRFGQAVSIEITNAGRAVLAR